MRDSQRLRSKTNQKTQLQAMTVLGLKRLAIDAGVAGVSGLRKDALVERIMQSGSEVASSSDLEQDDCLKVSEAGPFWLSLEWKVTPRLVERASAALGQDWHRAEKVLRLYRVDWDDSGPHAREHVRDETLPEEATNWFLRIDGTSVGWKVELGYLVPGGKFFSLLHSPDLEADQGMRHQFSGPGTSGDEVVSRSQRIDSTELSLHIEGDIALNGKTLPGAEASVDDDSVDVHAETGQFHWQAPLHNGRVIIPVVAEVSNQRLRAVISIESTIHYLEPEKTGLG